MEDPIADVTAAVKELGQLLKNTATEYKKSITKANPESNASKNFTWEHFFTEHCGILPVDAVKYESALIAHRMNPLDTLFESLALVIEFGRIPIGDKLKISKTIKAKEQEMEKKNDAMRKARKTIGLDKYNEFEARMIMELAGGDSEYHIDYGIEQFEDWVMEMDRMVTIQMVKNPYGAVAENYEAGASVGRITKDPTFQLLRSFGYETFEYTKDKIIDEAVVHSRPTTSDPLVETLLLGNMSLNEDVPEHMYT